MHINLIRRLLLSFVGQRVFLTILLVLSLGRPETGGAQVTVNEFMADNQTVAPLLDFPDYFPDYVELYNTTTADIDLGANGGWRIADSGTNFTFRPGTIIKADSFLLVFCDSDTNAPGIHTGFGLGDKGDSIALISAGGLSMVESNQFGLQIPDHSVGRFPDFTGAFVLNLPTPSGFTNTAMAIPSQTNRLALLGDRRGLRINEWLALNVAAGGILDEDWLELYNPSTNAVLLSGLVLSDDKTNGVGTANLDEAKLVRPLSFIAPRGFVQFSSPLVGGANGADEIKFSISSTSGDHLYIFEGNSVGDIIDHVQFAAYPQPNSSRGRLPDGGEVSDVPLTSLTPEASNFSTINEIIITELLTHTDRPLEDAVELYNPTATNVNIGGWWLTNDRNQPQKYRIPTNTIVPAGGYFVIYEVAFTNEALAANPFTFNSSQGEECYLFKARPDETGTLTGVRRGISFGAAANGVSFQRYVTSEGKVDIVASSDLSFGTTVRAGDSENRITEFRSGTGATNPLPRVGPIVINEIHYNPPKIIVPGVSTNDNTLDEFVEFRNISGGTVPLFFVPQGNQPDDFATNKWKVRGDIKFEFEGFRFIAPSEYFLLVNFDPDTNVNFTTSWKNANGVSSSIRIFGPYRGKLSNSSSAIELYRPDEPQSSEHPDFGYTPQILVDMVDYSDTAPWPTNGVDGLGGSIHRIDSFAYGNDPINWLGIEPSPGRGDLPTITTQPRPKSVRVGESATFTVVARGDSLQYQWRFNGVPLDGQTSASLTLTSLLTNQAGLYSVSVSNVAGGLISSAAQLTVTPDLKRPTVAFVAPAAGSGTTNGVLTVTGTAKDETGVASVEYAVGDGAFTAASGTNAWSKWSAVVALQPGTNVVAVRSVDLAGNLSLTNRRSFFSTVRAPLTLTTNGLGKVTGATNQQLLTIGKSYTLTATPGSGQLFSNWTGGVTGTALKKSFLMESNLVVTANFVPNPFLATKGVYRGLFHETNCVRNESAGYFTFTLADKGGYSAALYRVGKKHPLSGQLNLEGRATNRISLTRTTALEVTWAVDLHGSNLLTGTVSNGVWTAALLGDLGVTYTTLNPAPHAGRYTWVIPGAAGSTNEPAGDAAGTAVVDKANVVTFGGTLAEGTKVVQKVAVSRHGHWPLYVSLHSGKGSLLSWVNFDTNAVADDFHGPLCWVRPALPSLKSYTNGFNRDTVIQGSRYRPPPGTTNRVLNLTEGQLVVSGGRLTEDYTNNVFLLPNNKLTNGSPHQVTWTLKKDTGLISGTFQPTNGTRAVAWSGAVFQKTTNAFGWFLQTNQSGRVLLQTAP